jgi:hypothetical protein
MIYGRKKDPIKITPQNELPTEYYQRVQYADSAFREGRRPGSETDRGRIYILYGSPGSRESTGTILNDSELWLYYKPGGNAELRKTVYSDYFPGMMKFAFLDDYGVGIY